MKLADFSFELPDELIARFPKEERSESRLLVMGRQSGQLQDWVFKQLTEVLRPGDLLVFNNTKVIPARLHGQKASGGKVEVLVERLLTQQQALCFVRASKAPKPGAKLILADGRLQAEVTGRDHNLFILNFDCDDLLPWLEEVGEMPLPPYLKRPETEADHERYQTVYAKQSGAVAAPTAGLHFDQPLLQQLSDMGVEQCFVTLHVGAGTFLPVQVEDVTSHKMHKERLWVSPETVAAIAATKARGGKVIAVGTTSVRALESAAASGQLQACELDTDIFIYPGYQFRVVDGLITNFHLPESTLLMLVSAFSSRESILAAYQHAIDQRYRFFSYGDAMLLLPEE